MTRRCAVLSVAFALCFQVIGHADDPKPAPRFEPANDREHALVKMIEDLQAEVALLRKQLNARDGRERARDGDAGPERNRRDRDRPRDTVPRRDGDRPVRDDRVRRQSERIFATYDKDDDGVVVFEEWLKMREGKMTGERRARERRHFADPAGDDQEISLEEFYRWMKARQRGQARREGEQRRDADSPRRERDRDRGPSERD